MAVASSMRARHLSTLATLWLAVFGIGVGFAAVRWLFLPIACTFPHRGEAARQAIHPGMTASDALVAVLCLSDHDRCTRVIADDGEDKIASDPRWVTDARLARAMSLRLEWQRPHEIVGFEVVLRDDHLVRSLGERYAVPVDATPTAGR